MARQRQSAAHTADIAGLITEFEVAAGRKLSASELADELNHAGYKMIRGCQFSRIQVYRAMASRAAA